MVFETLIISVPQIFSIIIRGMSQLALRFDICLIILWVLICLAECGKCPLDGLHKPLDFDACSSHTSNYKGLWNTFDGYFCVDNAVGQLENVCDRSELFCVSSNLDGFNSETRHSRIGILDVNYSGGGTASLNKLNKDSVNTSWSPDHCMYHAPNGGIVACSLYYGEFVHEIASSLNKVDQIVFSLCELHLPHQKNASSFSKNFEIEKFQFEEPSGFCTGVIISGAFICTFGLCVFPCFSNNSASSNCYLKVFGDTEMNKFVLKNWRGQNTTSGLSERDDHDLLFLIVSNRKYSPKPISVKTPTQQPVTIHLISNEGGNCISCKSCILQSSPRSIILDSSIKPSRYGFSLINSTLTEAYLHPYGSAKLYPILFHPSYHCEWKSPSPLRNNFSGVDWLDLHGSSGSLSLALLEGSNFVRRLDFNLNLLYPLNMSPLDLTSDDEGATSACHKPLSKKLFAVNNGDSPAKVHRIRVSGRECELDGFIVHNCEGFALWPGESIELGISFRSDFFEPVVFRDLELVLDAGLLAIPMKASLPLHVLSFCRKSIFWLRVKKCCLTVFLAAILISFLLWFIMLQLAPDGSLDCLVKGENDWESFDKPKDKSSLLNYNKGIRKGYFRSFQRDQDVAIKSGEHSNFQHGILEQGIVPELKSLPVVSQTDDAPSSNVPVPKETGVSPSRILKSAPVESMSKIEEAQPVNLMVNTRKVKRRRSRKRKGAASGLTAPVEVSSSQSGNSTPASPLSPSTMVLPGNTCSPSIKRQSPVSSSPFSAHGGETGKVEKADFGDKLFGESRKCSGNILPTQPSLPVSRKTSRPMLLPSATFPGMTRQCPSRLAISPRGRAPGPLLLQAIEAEEKTSSDDSFTYDIWGNHFPRIHLVTKPNDPSSWTSETIEGNSDSFFIRGPQETLLTHFTPRSCK